MRCFDETTSLVFLQKLKSVTRAATNWYFREGAKWCNFLLHLTNTHVCENFGGGNCPMAPFWLRACQWPPKRGKISCNWHPHPPGPGKHFTWNDYPFQIYRPNKILIAQFAHHIHTSAVERVNVEKRSILLQQSRGFTIASSLSRWSRSEYHYACTIIEWDWRQLLRAEINLFFY